MDTEFYGQNRAEVSPVLLPPGRTRFEYLTGFESTYLPDHDTDVLEMTGHAQRVDVDLRLVAVAGLRTIRYPAPWHRVEREPGRYDWT